MAVRGLDAAGGWVGVGKVAGLRQLALKAAEAAKRLEA